MKKNHNIEELKYLVADHLTGLISKEDNDVLEKALQDSVELREFRDEMKRTLEFVKNVKIDEPSSNYWNSLLPRIHQRIEENESSSFSWDNIASLWKILVPVAAILLIAIIYYIARPVDPGVTKDEKTIEEIKKDSSQDKIEKKSEGVTPKTGNTVKEELPIENRRIDKKKLNKTDQKNIVKEEAPLIDGKEPNQEPVNENLASIDIEEISVFGSGEAAGLDEETENELKKLNDNQLQSLIQDLEQVNL